MNRINVRLWIGGALVVLGLLMLLERVGLFRGITSVFWGLIFLAAGTYFLYRFIRSMRGEWWAAIPAGALLGIGLESLAGTFLPDWGGFFFLALLGLGFFAIYFADRQRWWALIPGGMLVTLGCITVLGNAFGDGDTGGLVLIGFGLTFILLALLARLQWAWIPGVIFIAIGAFVGTPFEGAGNYILPAILIIGGGLLILQFARKR